MKYLLAVLVALALAGCTTVPVTVKFPPAPEELLYKCPDSLTTVGDKPTLSDLTKTVVENYTEYHLCSERVNLWIEWYETQKSIYGKFK